MVSISSFKGFSNTIIFLILLVSLHNYAVNSTEFEVGGDSGWAVPHPKDVDHFNHWASKNRFKANDTLHFKYAKDSVLEVTEENYEKCGASHPVYFSNNGDTSILLNRPDLFYFISGVGGHCERGMKMVIKVLGSPENPSESDQPANQTSPPSRASGLGISFSFQAILLVFSITMLLGL